MSSSKSNHTSADGHGDASGSSFVPGNKDPATVKGTTALGNANDKADDDDASNSSDVEMTGIELDNDDDVEMEEEEELDEDGANDTAKASTTSGNDPVAAEDETLLTEEAKELEEARKERLELMAAELQHKANLLGRGEGAAVAAGEGRPPSTSHLNDDDAAAQQQQQPIPLTPQERLEYLIAQSDVFAHFLAGASVLPSEFGQLLTIYPSIHPALTLVLPAVSAPAPAPALTGITRHRLCCGGGTQGWQAQGQGWWRNLLRRAGNDSPPHRSRRRRANAQVGPIQTSGCRAAGQTTVHFGPDLSHAPVPTRRPQLAHQIARPRHQRRVGRRNVRAGDIASTTNRRRRARSTDALFPVSSVFSLTHTLSRARSSSRSLHWPR